MDPLLQVENASKHFGSLAAVKDLSFQVFPEKIFGIAGPNGAGKTTLFNSITNVPYTVDSGRIVFDGKDITKLGPYRICHLGIARTFQIPAIFPSLTAFENVVVGATFGKNIGLREVFRKAGVEETEIGRRALDALDYVGMLEKKDKTAKSFTLLDIKLLMIASALATRPRMIMLDEPVGGLARPEIQQCCQLIKKINEQGITIIIIEHIMAALMGLSDQVMILDYGEKICEGTPEKVSCDEGVIKAYLGKA